ncbi:MAG: hypothetical protein ACRYGK_06325, partial [Janthinobacterium lividum]
GNVVSANEHEGIYLTTNVTLVTIQGNLIGVDATGTKALGNAFEGVSNAASGIVIGGATESTRNVISANGYDGINTFGTDNIYLGNYIGTNAADTASLANALSGIALLNGGNTVGGSTAGSGNLISGNAGDGIYIDAPSGGDLVAGNIIGLDSRGAALGNGGNGIQIRSGANHQIGGAASGEGNTVAANAGQGIFIRGTGTSALLSANAIYDNGGLGIALDRTTMSTNDPGDADGGANNGQNYPLLLAAFSSADTVTVQGTLNSNASRNYRLEFFLDPSSGTGTSGAVSSYLGFVDVTTDGDGNAAFSATFHRSASVGLRISATATDTSTNDTSEFSLPMPVVELNAAPTGADNTVTILEDHPAVFKTADFGFRDDGNSTANGFYGIVVDTLPTVGLLTNDGILVRAGDLVLATDIAAGKLHFTPPANLDGKGLDSFTFRVRDDGGASNGGSDTDAVSRRITVDVNPVNDAPQGADHTVFLIQPIYTLAASDFGFADPNDQLANNFFAVRLATLPISGALTLNDVQVVGGQLISISDIDAGRLKYRPLNDGHLFETDSFTFAVLDNGGVADGGSNIDGQPRQMTIRVAPQTVGNLGTIVLAPVKLGNDATLVANGSAPEPANAVLSSRDLGNASSSRGSVPAPPKPASAAMAAAPLLNSERNSSRIVIINADASPVTNDFSSSATAAMHGNENRLSLMLPVASKMPANTEHGAAPLKENWLTIASMKQQNAAAPAQHASGDLGITIKRLLHDGQREVTGADYEPQRAVAQRVETAVLVSAIVTSWIVARKAALLASLLATVPSWVRIDPLPILCDDADSSDDETSAALITQADANEAVEEIFVVTQKTAGQETSR